MIRKSTRKRSNINTTHGLIELLDGSQTGPSQNEPVRTPSITAEDGSSSTVEHQVGLPDTVILPTSLYRDEDTSFPEARPQVCAVATTAVMEELNSLPPASSPMRSGPGSYSRDMVLQLADLFFCHVQPWLPLLHAPYFRVFLRERLGPRDDALAGMTPDEALLLTSIFALASRFIDPASLQGVPCSRLEDEYVAKAREYYAHCRDMDTHTFTYLQGCTALAFYFYSSGLSTQGWILVGVCVRVAYDLGLSEIDAAVDDPDSENDWTLTEERRRAWWLIWELDSFGSYVSQKPFAIDRSAFSVFLPVSDHDWFAGQRVPSARLPAGPEGSWAALRASTNQSERAWYLVAADILSQSAECLQQRSKVTSERLCMLKNEISCLRLALPPGFRLGTDHISSPASKCRSNWIIGTHLTLSTASFITEYLSLLDDCEGRRPGNSSNFSVLLQTRALEISRFAWRWPMEHIRSAHPFFACLLLTPYIPGLEFPLKSLPIASSGEVIKLIQSHLGEIWKLGLTAKRIVELSASQNVDNMVTSDLKLIRHHSVWFPPSVLRRAAGLLSASSRSLREQPTRAPARQISATISETSPRENEYQTEYRSLTGTRPGRANPWFDDGILWSPTRDFSDFNMIDLFEGMSNDQEFPESILREE